MLSGPEDGWTEVKCGRDGLGWASYTTDVPMDCLDAFIAYFSQEHRSLGFNIEFDAEGHEFGIVEFGGYLYAVDTEEDTGTPHIREIVPQALGLEPSSYPGEMLKVLGRELVSDIGDYLAGWVDWVGWSLWDGEELKKREERKHLLEEKCVALRKLLE